MDHDTPNYEQNGVMASLGEIMSFDTAGIGLMGGTEVYQNPGNLWFNSTKPYNEILVMGYSVLAYESPSLETFIYYDGHDGHDFAQSGAALAAGNGTVVFKGDYNDSLGLVVEIFHPQGYLTRYAHLAAIASSLDVGTAVIAGQQIGTIGGSAIIDGTVIRDYWGTHLHFSVFRWDGDKWNIVDPFGWDPWAGPDKESRIRKQQEDPLIQCNGEISYPLWVGGWPQNIDNSGGLTVFGPTEDRYVGGWLKQTLPSFPNGQIAFMKDGDIFLFDFLTEEDTQITFSGNNHDPDWSFDGEYILYIHGEGTSASIVVLDKSWIKLLLSRLAPENGLALLMRLSGSIKTTKHFIAPNLMDQALNEYMKTFLFPIPPLPFGMTLLFPLGIMRMSALLITPVEMGISGIYGKDGKAIMKSMKRQNLKASAQ